MNVASVIVDVAPGQRESGEIVALLIGGEGTVPQSHVDAPVSTSPC